MADKADEIMERDKDSGEENYRSPLGGENNPSHKRGTCPLFVNQSRRPVDEYRSRYQQKFLRFLTLGWVFDERWRTLNIPLILDSIIEL